MENISSWTKSSFYSWVWESLSVDSLILHLFYFLFGKSVWDVIEPRNNIKRFNHKLFLKMRLKFTRKVVRKYINPFFKENLLIYLKIRIISYLLVFPIILNIFESLIQFIIIVSTQFYLFIIRIKTFQNLH